MEETVELKYQIVKDFIINYIKSGNLKYNDKVFSEQELMQLCNVSRHTVRKAIDKLVNEGWLYKQQGKGTFVADPSAHIQKKSKLIGFVATYISDYIFPEIISGMEEVLSKNGYSIILGNTNNKVEKERSVLMSMLENDLDGLIIEPTKSALPHHNKDLLQKFVEKNIPILHIHALYPSEDASFIVEDDVKAGEIATKHLIELGHKHIGAIFKNDDIQGHRRYEGFINCLRENNVALDEDSIIWYTTEEQLYLFDEIYGKQLLERLKGCTAVICYNDQIALRLLELFKYNGILVPGDYSIVSFDDSLLSRNSQVTLTSVAHPKSLLGAKAANTMLEMINNKTLKIKEQMEPELIIRESTQRISSL